MNRILQGYLARLSQATERIEAAGQSSRTEIAKLKEDKQELTQKYWARGRKAAVLAETSEAFVPVLRRLMAEFRAPYVPDLPRFTGGAVGFIGYDAAVRFEPALRDAWLRRAGLRRRPRPR